MNFTDAFASAVLLVRHGASPYATTNRNEKQPICFFKEEKDKLEFLREISDRKPYHELPASPRVTSMVPTADTVWHSSALITRMYETHIIQNRHESPQIQRAYDKRYGLIKLR